MTRGPHDSWPLYFAKISTDFFRNSLWLIKFGIFVQKFSYRPTTLFIPLTSAMAFSYFQPKKGMNMLNELIQLSFDKIMQTRTYTVIVLAAGEKKFAIYTAPSTGKTLQIYLTGGKPARPQTHDFIQQMFLGMTVRVRQVVINDVQDTTYFARVFIEHEMNGLNYIYEIDVRPSDGIILALMNNAPVYCTHEVLDKTITIQEG